MSLQDTLHEYYIWYYNVTNLIYAIFFLSVLIFILWQIYFGYTQRGNQLDTSNLLSIGFLTLLAIMGLYYRAAIHEYYLWYYNLNNLIFATICLGTSVLLVYQCYMGYISRDKGRGLKEGWKKDRAEDLARLIETRTLNDFWNSNINLILGPQESAVLVRDGKIEEVLTQQKLKNVAGGFGNWLGEKLDVKSNLDLLLVDNKPFQIEVGAEGLTKDDIAQRGLAKILLRIDHEKSNRLMGVLREKEVKRKDGFFKTKEVVAGYETYLTRSQVEQMLAEEAQIKVFRKVIANYEAKVLGSSREVDEDVATATKVELRKTLDLWGMSIENIYVDWSLNAYQIWRAQRAPTAWIRKAEEDEAEQEQIRQIEFEKRRRERERKLETQEKEWTETDKAKALKSEVKQLAHQREVAVEKTRLKTDIDALEQDAELSKKRKEEDLKVDVEKAEAQRDREELEGLLDVKGKMQEQKLASKRQDQEHEKELAKIKADVDKTVGTAQAKAKAGEDTKKKRERKFLVEAVYLIYNDGRLMAKSLSEKQETDAEILTGMLSAVGDFVSDSLGKKGHLGTMQHGDNTILIEPGKECHLAAVTYGKPGKGLKKALKNQLSVIEDEYIKDLKDWNGDMSLFADCTTNLVKIILQSTAKNRSEAD